MHAHGGERVSKRFRVGGAVRHRIHRHRLAVKGILIRRDREKEPSSPAFDVFLQQIKGPRGAPDLTAAHPGRPGIVAESRRVIQPSAAAQYHILGYRGVKQRGAELCPGGHRFPAKEEPVPDIIGKLREIIRIKRTVALHEGRPDGEDLIGAGLRLRAQRETGRGHKAHGEKQQCEDKGTHPSCHIRASLRIAGR